APKSRSLPGGRVGSTAPVTAFGRRATASKAGSQSTTYGAHRLPSRPPLRLLWQLRVRRRCSRQYPGIRGAGSASVRAEEDRTEGNGTHMMSVPADPAEVQHHAQTLAQCRTISTASWLDPGRRG